MNAGRYDDLVAEYERAREIGILPTAMVACDAVAAALRECEEENARLRGSDVLLALRACEDENARLRRGLPVCGDPYHRHSGSCDQWGIGARLRAEVETLRTERDETAAEALRNLNLGAEGIRAARAEVETLKATIPAEWLAASDRIDELEEKGARWRSGPADDEQPVATGTPDQHLRRESAGQTQDEHEFDYDAHIRDAWFRLRAEVETLRTRAERAEGLADHLYRGLWLRQDVAGAVTDYQAFLAESTPQPDPEEQP